MFKKIIIGLLMGIGIAFSQSTYLTSTEPSKATIDGVEYYQISKCTELAWFRDQVNSGSTEINAILTKNVNCYANSSIDTTNVTNWIPIGRDSTHAYKGIFDGREYTISNIFMNKNNTLYGLFGYVSGKILNLNTKGFFYDLPLTNLANDTIGGIVGMAYNGALLKNLKNTLFANQSMIDTIGTALYKSVKNVKFGYIVGVMDSATLDGSVLKSSDIVDTAFKAKRTHFLVGRAEKSLIRNSGIEAVNSSLSLYSDSTTYENSYCFYTSLNATGSDNNYVNVFWSNQYTLYLDSWCWRKRYSGTEYELNRYYSNAEHYTVIDQNSIQNKGVVSKPIQDDDDEQGYLISLNAVLNSWVEEQLDYDVYKKWNINPAGYSYLVDVDSLERDLWTDDGNYDVSWYSSGQTNFKISSIKQLAGLAVIANSNKSGFHDDFNGKKIELSANLNSSDIASHIWVPIGTRESPFAGTFNGNGFSISKLYTDLDSKWSGLFGYTRGSINKVRVTDAEFNGSMSGCIALYNSGVIDSSFCSAQILGVSSHEKDSLLLREGVIAGGVSRDTISRPRSGGLVARNFESGIVSNSEFNGQIVGGNAGIVSINDGKIKNVVARGSLTQNFALPAYFSSSGGIVAYNSSTGKIENAISLIKMHLRGLSNYNNKITKDSNVSVRVGGIVGYNEGLVEKTVSLADTIDFSVRHFALIAGIAGYNSKTGVINQSKNSASLYAHADSSQGYTTYLSWSPAVCGISGINDGEIQNSFNEGELIAINGTTSINIAGISCRGYGKIYNSYNSGNMKTDGIYRILLADSNYIANSYNIGSVSGRAEYGIFAFGRGVKAYNAYSLSNNFDSLGYSLTDSYTYDAYAAVGTSKMTYFDLDSGAEAKGTLLNALNHWVKYRFDTFNETYVSWKQGEKYPELDIEWNVSESSSSSSENISSSSDLIIESSSSNEFSISSSSNEFESSSSANEESSSANVESSSSLNASCSSIESGSSSSITTLVRNVVQPTFNIAVNGMTLTIFNVQEGTVQVFDALGHLVNTKQIVGSVTSVTLSTSGSYIVRINGISQMVILK